MKTNDKIEGKEKMTEEKDILEFIDGITIIKKYPKVFAKAVRTVYSKQVAHKDFRKILREMKE